MRKKLPEATRRYPFNLVPPFDLWELYPNRVSFLLLSLERPAFFLKQLEQRYRLATRPALHPDGVSISQEPCSVWPMDCQRHGLSEAVIER